MHSCDQAPNPLPGLELSFPYIFYLLEVAQNNSGDPPHDFPTPWTPSELTHLYTNR